MNQPETIPHYPSVSDDIVCDNGAKNPIHPEMYKRLDGFNLGSTNAWTKGQPFDYFKRMREQSPVMWTEGRKPTSGFWSVSRYEDVKHVELNPGLFSSQRGSMQLNGQPWLAL